MSYWFLVSLPPLVVALAYGRAPFFAWYGAGLVWLATLAWLLQRGPHVIPIPGTTSLAHLADNLGAADVTLAPEVVDRLEALVNQRTVTGPRYTAASQREIDTEEFAA